MASPMPKTSEVDIRRSSTMNLLNKWNLVPSRVVTLNIMMTMRSHVVTLTAGSCVSLVNRPIAGESVQRLPGTPCGLLTFEGKGALVEANTKL